MAAYDAIVIGGGIVGLSAAYHLVRQGAGALLVDHGHVGRATDAGAGILSIATDLDHPEPYYRLAAHAAADYPRLIEGLSAEDAGETGYAVCGSLTVAVDEDEVPALEAVRASLAGRHAYEEVTPDRACELFPPLGQVRGAIWQPCGARVDGRLLAGALRRAAEARGLEVRRAEVSGLRLRGDRVRGVALGADEVEAGCIVIATGAWSAGFGTAFGVRIPVAPQRGQIAHLELPGADTSAWPIVSSFGSEHYMVSWNDSRVAVGATREARSGFEPRSTIAGIHELLSEALRLAPGLAEAGLREVRVGLRPASADGLPILGPIPNVANALLATGHGPVGLQLGPYSGRLIAGMIVDGAPEIDISDFRLERFL